VSRVYDLFGNQKCSLIVLDYNQRIYNQDDGIWNIKGRYKMAMELDEDLVWTKNKGGLVTHILAVSLINLYSYIALS
jgi:hypothetical protein